MTRAESISKWIIRIILALPMAVLLGVMGVAAVSSGGIGWGILPCAAFVLVCFAIWHSELNYGIGWPSATRVLQVAILWAVVFGVCIALNWNGKVSISRMDAETTQDSIIMLAALMSPIFAILTPIMLFFAPGRSLFRRWPQPGEYDGS